MQHHHHHHHHPDYLSNGLTFHYLHLTGFPSQYPNFITWSTLIRPHSRPCDRLIFDFLHRCVFFRYRSARIVFLRLALCAVSTRPHIHFCVFFDGAPFRATLLGPVCSEFVCQYLAVVATQPAPAITHECVRTPPRLCDAIRGRAPRER